MQNYVPEQEGLTEARAVARGETTTSIDVSHSKLLSFFLRQGECTAEVSESRVSVWFSWLPRWKPSTYFVTLAPGLVLRLMQLGRAKSITDDAVFQVGPGRTGTGRYAFDFQRKWVRIQCHHDWIVIRIREEQEGLYHQKPQFTRIFARCERCKGELRTPVAKQCCHCGLDWH